MVFIHYLDDQSNFEEFLIEWHVALKVNCFDGLLCFRVDSSETEWDGHLRNLFIGQHTAHVVDGVSLAFLF